MVNLCPKEMVIIDHLFLEYCVMHRLLHKFAFCILRENTISLKIIIFCVKSREVEDEYSPNHRQVW